MSGSVPATVGLINWPLGERKVRLSWPVPYRSVSATGPGPSTYRVWVWVSPWWIAPGRGAVVTGPALVLGASTPFTGGPAGLLGVSGRVRPTDVTAPIISL